jgi:hypothetical protein
MRRERKNIEVFSLSMLDVICGALGAFAILVVILINAKERSDDGKKVSAELLEFALKDIERLEKKTVAMKRKSDEAKPTLFGLPLKAKDAVFLVDVSGSMVWQQNNLKSVVEDLVRAVDMKHFRVLYFSSDVHSDTSDWPHEWLEGTDSNKALAVAEIHTKIDDFLTTPGGTNTHAALHEALAWNRGDVFFLITDGYPTQGVTDTHRILNTVGSANSSRTPNAIINSIMVGLPGSTMTHSGEVVFDPNAKPKELYDFLHELAMQNNGGYIGR